MKLRNSIKQALAFTMVGSLLASCSSSGGETTQSTSSGGSTSSSSAGTTTTQTTSTEKLKIVTSTFPEYDWVREILGDNISNVDLTMLLDGGVDLHSYAPSVDDIITISTADLFIYNGGESTDAWVEDVLDQKTNDDMVIVNLLESLGDLALESEHFHYGEDSDTEEDEHDHDHDHDEDEHDHDHDHDEDEHDHDHDEDDHDHDHDEDDHDHDHDEDDHDHDHGEDEHDHDHDEDEHDHDHDEDEHDHDHDEDEHDDDHDHSHGSHDDEHFWMSINNAKILSTLICEKITEIDSDNGDSYSENLDAYLEKLSDLDKEYKEMVNSAATNVILVADRFPFVYLASDYNLEYHAAFSGCSAETEASFEVVVALTEIVNDLDLSYLLTTETGHAIAETIVDNSNSKDQEILALDSMQSTTSKSGDTYLSIMSDNLVVLSEVLN